MKRLGENISTSSKYAASDALTNNRNYTVGLATVFIVVCFVALLQNAVVRSSSIFVRLSETQVSETDILLTPDLAALQFQGSNGGFPQFWLNETLVRERLADNPRIRGTSPRWTLLAKAVNPKTERNSSVIVLVMDTQRETEIGMGRTWIRRPLKWDETYVSAALLRTLNITASRGEKIRLQIDLLQLIPGFDVADLSPALYDAFRTTLDALAIAVGNGTINVNQTLQSLGLNLPDDFCVPQTNLSAVELRILCPFNGTLFGLDFDSPLEIPAINATLPLDQACVLFPDGNVTVDLSALNNVTGLCVRGLDLNAVRGDQLADFFDAFSLPVFEALIGPQIPALLSPKAELTVVEAVFDPDGKWPDALGNVLTVERSEAPQLLREMLPTNNLLLQTLLNALGPTSVSSGAQVNITTGGNLTLVDSIVTLNSILDALGSLRADTFNQYALLIVVMIQDRYSVYLQSPEAAASTFVSINNDIFNAMGYRFAAVPQNPVQLALEGVLFVKLFLDQIFGSVMAVLIVLGAMLIYALLLGNVSDKTYEYGMLRALGFERNSLIGLLLISSAFFTIPGIGLGLIGAWFLWVPLSLLFQLLTSAPPDYSLDWSSIVLAVVVGVVMPIVANIGPIKRALSRTLRDSLDVYHNVQDETNVKIIKLKDIGFRPLSFFVSVVVILIGFLVYYLIPYAFTYNNFPLFLGILQVMLLSMVLGLCLIATTLQPFLERIVLWCIVWGRDANLLSLMQKNMSAHRPRNQKTALMFTISLGFIIFAGASFSLQAATVGDTVSSFIGADGNVFAASWNNPLPEADLRMVLETELSLEGTLLVDYAFATFHLRSSPQVIETRISNLAAEPTRRINVYGLERNHLKVVYERFFVPIEFDSSVTYNNTIGQYPDVVESLFSGQWSQQLPFEQSPEYEIPPEFLPYPSDDRFDSRNNTQVYTEYIDVVVSEALRESASLSTTTPLRYYFQVRDSASKVQTIYFYAKARALAQKVPGFYLSSYQLTATGSPMFVSMDSYVRMTNYIDSIMEGTRDSSSENTYRNVSGVPPKENLWFSMRPEASVRDVNDLIDKLRNFLDDSMQTLNVKGLVASTSTASNAMLIFFNVVAIINSVLAFFLLWISFDANVRFNGWEVGVIRSLGVSASQVTRAYIYEALAVVVTAVTLGTVVGILVSIVLTLQFGLFLELPFVLYFPVALFLIVFVLSVLLSVLGAFIPANQFARKTISNVIRGI